jgi:hypothetical protein
MTSYLRPHHPWQTWRVRVGPCAGRAIGRLVADSPFSHGSELGNLGSGSGMLKKKKFDKIHDSDEFV